MAWYRKGPTDTSSTRTLDVRVAVAVANVLIPDALIKTTTIRTMLVAVATTTVQRNGNDCYNYDLTDLIGLDRIVQTEYA